MKTKKREGKSLGIGFLFCFLIGAILLISFSFKAYLSIKNSKYDSSTPFVVMAKEKGRVDIFEATPQKLKILGVKGDNASLKDQVYVPANILTERSKREAQSLQDFFLSIVLSSDKLTYFDKVKFFIFSKTISSENVDYLSLTISIHPEDNFNSQENFLSDPQIVSDKTTVQVINATGESNVAGAFAKKLEVLGANVILTTTASQDSSASKIYYKGEKPIIAKFVENLLGFKAIETDDNNLADVTITLGKDSLGKF